MVTALATAMIKVVRQGLSKKEVPLNIDRRISFRENGHPVRPGAILAPDRRRRQACSETPVSGIILNSDAAQLQI